MVPFSDSLLYRKSACCGFLLFSLTPGLAGLRRFLTRNLPLLLLSLMKRARSLQPFLKSVRDGHVASPHLLPTILFFVFSSFPLIAVVYVFLPPLSQEGVTNRFFAFLRSPLSSREYGAPSFLPLLSPRKIERRTSPALPFSRFSQSPIHDSPLLGLFFSLRRVLRKRPPSNLKDMSSLFSFSFRY